MFVNYSNVKTCVLCHLQSCRVMKCSFSTVPSSNITSDICCCLLKFVITNKWNKNYRPLSSPVTFLWQTVAVYWSSLMAVVGGACIRQYQVCVWYVLKYSMPPPFHSSPLLSPLFLKCSNCQVYGMHYRLLFFCFVMLLWVMISFAAISTAYIL